MNKAEKRTTYALLDAYGRTYSEEAGIRLRDEPQPLYQLLVLSCLLSARIQASIAVAAARALFAAGMRGPRAMADATWQQRVDALGTGGYRRYDERTSAQLGEGARMVLDEYGGDLRRVRREADGDVETLQRLLRQAPGLGSVGAVIFLREVQYVWPETVPFVDAKVMQGAGRIGLPEDSARLARMVTRDEMASFTAALVRCALSNGVAGEVREKARTSSGRE